MSYAVVKPVIDYSVRKLCVRKYHNHSKGCPNFGKKGTCPPEIPLFCNVFDMTKDLYAVWNCFSFGKHVSRMKEKHPEWTQRQLECCLYWQGTARKQLKEKVSEFVKEHHDMYITFCPEGMGMNVTETMKSVGVELEWPPVNYTYQIAIAGIKI